jgi:hypothetical protein
MLHLEGEILLDTAVCDYSQRTTMQDCAGLEDQCAINCNFSLLILIVSQTDRPLWRASATRLTSLAPSFAALFVGWDCALRNGLSQFAGRWLRLNIRDRQIRVCRRCRRSVSLASKDSLHPRCKRPPQSAQLVSHPPESRGGERCVVQCRPIFIDPVLFRFAPIYIHGKA